MKSLKIFCSLLLSLLFLLTWVPVWGAASGSSAGVRFAVSADVHLRLPDSEIQADYPESELYYHAWGSGNLTHEAAGLLHEMLDDAEEKGAEFVLLCGDLAHHGTPEQHEYVADILRRFENDTGIPVYVIPGNHDYYHDTTPADFKALYAGFGYDEALTVDSGTASYTADLPGGYRLIAIDSNKPGDDGDGIDQRLLDWIAGQADIAVKEGKTPVAMMHHSLLDPIPYAEILMKDFIVRDHEKIAELFADHGIHYVFTGHEHGNDISLYTSKKGNKVYNILTTSLSSYPLEYRMVEMNSFRAEITMEQITELEPQYIPQGYNDAQRAAIAEDYTAFALGFFKFSVEKKISRLISPEFINGYLGDDSALTGVIDTLMPVVAEALYMPLYDQGDGKVSVEYLAKKAGAKLPESEYKYALDLVSSAVAMVYYGGEDFPTYSSPVGRLLIVTLNTLLKYVLSEAGNRFSAESLNRILALFGLDEIEELDVNKWNRIYVPGAGLLYIEAEAALSPLINKFATDDEVPDRDASLDASPEKTGFSARIKSFMERLFRILLSVFRTVESAC